MVWDFSIEITTKSLTVVNISDKTTRRLEWLLSLRNGGFSNKEISDHLNNQGILSPKDKEYSPKLIWVVIPPFVGLFETRITRPICTGSVS